jgi:DNA-binding NarL/FixJ family response regulator
MAHHAHAIRVLCVDDHRLVRDGIALIIGRQPDMRVVGLAATGEESIDLHRRLRPDVTLMDLRLRAMTGVDAIKFIRQENPQARIVVLTMYEGDEDIHRSLAAGAVTYLLKDSLAEDLVRVIRQVHLGQRPLSSDMQARLAERASHPALTPRELQVMNLLVQGMRNKEIAATLSNRESTIQVHVKNILAKLGVNDRTAAVTVALRRGIVHLG